MLRQTGQMMSPILEAEEIFGSYPVSKSYAFLLHHPS